MAARKEELIAAQGDLDLAWAQLREAMGVPDLKASELKPIEPRTFPQLPLDQEMATATKARPDLMALAQTQSAQASAVGAARSDFGPSVSAYGNWEEDRASLGSSGGNNWVAGVQISVDMLPIGKRAQLARETAAKQRIDAQLAASQQHVRLEVSQAHIRRQTAELSIETARAAMAQSAESLRILKNRYGAGLATITDLLRAEDAERQSQSNYWHAVYGNAMAYAELLYATGSIDSRCGGGFAMRIAFRGSLIAVLAAMVAGCHGGETASTVLVETMQARVVESQRQQVSLNIRSTGTVHARETAIVSAQVVGRIQQVLVREGDSVRAGQTMVVLDDATLRASADQSQAGVRAAQDEEAAAQTDAKACRQHSGAHTGPRAGQEGAPRAAKFPASDRPAPPCGSESARYLRSGMSWRRKWPEENVAPTEPKLLGPAPRPNRRRPRMSAAPGPPRVWEAARQRGSEDERYPGWFRSTRCHRDRTRTRCRCSHLRRAHPCGRNAARSGQ